MNFSNEETLIFEDFEIIPKIRDLESIEGGALVPGGVQRCSLAQHGGGMSAGETREEETTKVRSGSGWVVGLGETNAGKTEGAGL